MENREDRTDDGNLSAPELVLSLADSAPQPRLTATNLVAAGALLGIDAGAMRVAAARLVRKGVLAQQGRGVYRLGDRGGSLHRRIQAWDRVEDQVTAWDGRWLGVFTAHLGRSDKVGLRARERALRLKGFAVLRQGLAVRPANLRTALPGLRAELVELGLQPQALVLGIDALASEQVVDPATLWDVAALSRRYAANVERLVASTHRVAGLDTQSAARETLLVGRAVMHDIVLDPLLPDAMVDTMARRRMITAMRDYDRLGKACWRAFYRALDG